MKVINIYNGFVNRLKSREYVFLNYAGASGRTKHTCIVGHSRPSILGRSFGFLDSRRRECLCLSHVKIIARTMALQSIFEINE